MFKIRGMGITCAASPKMQRTQVRTSRNMSEPSDRTNTYQTYIVPQCLYLFVLTVLYQGLVNVCKCPNWTSPKYWGYNLQQIRFQVMFKIPKMGHLPNPVIAGFKLLWIGYLSTREMWKSAGDLNPFAGMGMGWLTDYSWLGCLRGASQDTMPFLCLFAFSP